LRTAGTLPDSMMTPLSDDDLALLLLSAVCGSFQSAGGIVLMSSCGCVGPASGAHSFPPCSFLSPSCDYPGRRHQGYI